LRILHLRSGRGLYGAEGVILALARETRRAGHEPLIAALWDRRGPDRTLVDCASAEGLEATTLEVAGRIDPLAIPRLAALARARRCDLLHAHDYKTIALAVPAAALLGLPLVANLHGDTAETRRIRLYEWLNYRLLRFCQRVVAVSRELRARAAAFVDAARLVQIDNGIDLDRLRAGVHPHRTLRVELGVPPEAPLLGIVGRLAPEKGHSVLLEALGRLARRWRRDRPRPHLLVVGHGPRRASLEAAAHAHGLEHRVHFLGQRADLPDLYAALDLLVHPSLREGLPLVVLEAAALGVPVVASSVGAIPEALDHGAAGILLPPGDVDALAAALDHALGHPAHMRSLGARAAQQIASHYSARAMTARYLDEVYLPLWRQLRSR
jgi:glycosyltransferase involved in cell wall biosynthesis